MSENTNKTDEDAPAEKFSLEVTRQLPQDEVETARILFQEGLIEEAKKTLFRVLSHQPGFASAKKLLVQIEDLEMKALFVEGRSNRPREKPSRPENVANLIDALDRDLGLGLEVPLQATEEIWNAVPAKKEKFSSQEYLDLGIAFFEMECFADALRELLRAERKIRIEQSFLGEVGVTVVSMIARCLIPLGRAFDAKAFLEPVLIEPDLNHEDKLCLYHAMGLVEDALGSTERALGWYKQVVQMDPAFRDVQNRIRLLMNSK